MEQPARLAISGAVGGCCFSRRRSRYALMSACLVRSLRRRRPSFWRCLGFDRSICCSMLDVGTRWLIEANALVPLHRGFDDLIGAWPQSWQGGWVDEQLDAACDARLASDQAGALDGEGHLMD